MNSLRFWTKCSVLLVASVLFVSFAVSSSAQVQSTTSTTSGIPTQEVKIESGEVVAVKGNDLFVKMSDGTLRHFPNVPETARVTVDGQQLGIHDLMPGMKLVRATVTTTTPQVVTTVQTVTGKVWHVTPPSSLILTLEDGKNQEFKIPEGQKFMVDGQETDAWGLKQGMVVTAAKVVETPATSVTTQKEVVGTMPRDVPVLILIPQ
jgi:Rieske Fe-S protein